MAKLAASAITSQTAPLVKLLRGLKLRIHVVTKVTTK
jgi:hypothetical protein